MPLGMRLPSRTPTGVCRTTRSSTCCPREACAGQQAGRHQPCSPPGIDTSECRRGALLAAHTLRRSLLSAPGQPYRPACRWVALPSGWMWPCESTSCMCTWEKSPRACWTTAHRRLWCVRCTRACPGIGHTLVLGQCADFWAPHR